MSAATYNEIRSWFDRGAKDGRAYMVVWCDTYDYTDYPSYHDTAADARFDIAHPNSMAKVMEVYDLREDRDSQLNQRRCWSLPKEEQ